MLVYKQKLKKGGLMTKLIKKITVPFVSLLFLLNMSNAGIAETTVSVEV